MESRGGLECSDRARRATTQFSVEDSTTRASFPKVNLRRRSRAPPLPGLKELHREPSGPLATTSLYAREKPKQKPEVLGGKLLKMRYGGLRWSRPSANPTGFPSQDETFRLTISHLIQKIKAHNRKGHKEKAQRTRSQSPPLRLSRIRWQPLQLAGSNIEPRKQNFPNESRLHGFTAGLGSTLNVRDCRCYSASVCGKAWHG